MHEKPFFRTLNAIADWIIRIVVINIFMILCTIPLITFYAGYKAGYSLFTDYIEGKPTPIFKGFWENLKENFWYDVGVGALFVLFILVGLFSLWQYNALMGENPEKIFYLIASLIVLGITLLTIITMVYSVTISYIFKDISVKNMVKLSMAISGKYFLRSLLVLILTVGPLFLMISPLLAPIFVLLGLSVPVTLNTLLMRKVRSFLKGDNRNV